MNYKEHLSHPIFNVVSEIIETTDQEAYVIGGYVRDLFLKRQSKDIDIVVIGSGIELATKVNKKIGNSQINVFKNFGTAMIRMNDWEIEFVGARKESYRSDSRKPIVEDGSLSDDQNRRDFTINAMALSLHPNNFGDLLDPFGGMRDLEELTIKTPLEPNITFSDDPLRMMRAIRFASQLDFAILPETIESINKQKDRIKIVSKERIIDELNKIILSPKPSIGFYLLDKVGLLEIIFPQFCKLKGVDVIDGQQHKNNFHHTLKVLDNISHNTSNLWLRWAAILHDIAKPLTKRFVPGIGWTFHTHEFIGSKHIPSIFKQLKLPLNDKMKYVQKLVALHHRPIIISTDQITDSAIRRLLFDAGDDIDDLLTLCEADITSKNKEKVKKYINNFKLVKDKLVELEEKDKIRNMQPPISGDEIMKHFNLSPCREIGIIKNAIKDAILDGQIPNEYNSAKQFMIDKGKEIGLT